MKILFVTLIFTYACTNELIVEDVVGSNPCLACHHLTETRVGPSFIDISNRYRNDAAAVEKLKNVILNGGKGNWGRIPMPPMTGLSDVEAKKFAEWIVQKSPLSKHRNNKN